ncbi:MAG TPA: hypothetical protein VF945_22270 [Polyangia bacterium]
MESAEHPSALAARARRAYERGRLRWALQIGWIVLALVGVSYVFVGGSPVSAATGAALFLAATAMRWRGRTLGASVRAGLAAGLIPFALLVSLKCGSGMFCALGGCMSHCARFCGLGGLAAGLLLAARARQHDDHVVEFLVGASVIAALTGLIGCFVGGLAGMAWRVVGELVATVPAFALELRR